MVQGVSKEYLTVQTEGKREVQRQVTHYALPMIIAVGYRVRSSRATQFRQWATRTLGEYMLKGFVLDDWCKYVDSFMEFNEQTLLDNVGSISQKQMKAITGARHSSQVRIKRRPDHFPILFTPA